MSALSKKLRDAEGGMIMFWCPGCESSHGVWIDRAGHPVWGYNGNPDAPTFTPSILVTYRHPKGHTNDNPAPVGYNGEYVNDICHSYITDGKIQFLGDCTHKLAGQTVDLPDWNSVADNF